MRSRFDMQLEDLKREMTAMGMLCENAIAKSSHALLNCDLALAGELPELLGRVTQKEQEAFRAGLEIGEKKPTAPAVLEILSSSEESEIRVTITEGKFHQIKRMFGAVGMKVLYLKRLSMGTLLLDPDLKPGQWRPLTEQEITQLKEERNVK